MIRKKSESGQVIILLVLGMVSLLGFAGLAIDGGRVFSERRNIQNVADTSAFTAALRIGRELPENITSGLMTNSALAAYDRADVSGYNNLDPDVTVNVTVVKEVSSPYYVVTVDITSKVDPTFIQLVYSGDLDTSASAVARVRPRTDAGYGYAMVALAETECDAFKFSGNADVVISGSGIFSNSTCSCAISYEGGTDFSLDPDDEIAAAGGVCKNNENANVNFDQVEENLPQIEAWVIPPPDCSTVPNPVPAPTVSGNTVTFHPGNYWSSIHIVCGACTQIFEPGLYCIHHKNGFSVQNGNLSNQVGGVGGVTFYLTDGGFSVTGGVLNLNAPTSGKMKGMLIFLDKDNDQLVEIKADPGSTWEGTIYAPGPPYNTNLPKCSFSGNGDLVGNNLQFVCYTIELIGTADLYLNFDGSNNYEPPVGIDLVQ